MPSPRPRPARKCPTGYLPADGRSLPVSQYSALYSLIGTAFGGSGSTSGQPFPVSVNVPVTFDNRQPYLVLNYIICNPGNLPAAALADSDTTSPETGRSQTNLKFFRKTDKETLSFNSFPLFPALPA